MKCSELAKELGIHHLKVVHARRKGFPAAKGDLTDEHVLYVCEKLKQSLAKEEAKACEVKEPPPPERVVITFSLPNSKFVECMSSQGRVGRHRLLLPHGSRANFPVGRALYACWIDYQGADCYVHTSIVDKYWRPDE